MTGHTKRDADCETPHAVHALREAGKPDRLQLHAANGEDRQEALIDQALEEILPASDPVSAKRITHLLLVAKARGPKPSAARGVLCGRHPEA